jgi:release factor glutamine methyltransferase
MTVEPRAWTILEVLRWTTSRFEGRGMASPRLDAELLAAHAFGLSRVQLYTQFDRPLDATELQAYRELVKRRQAGEPVAYISNRKEFWSLALAVDKRVLVPRPETELLVQVALERIAAGARARVVDVGTGSGAIALAIARDRSDAEVTATDVSEGALAVARANAERLGLAVTFRQSDLLTDLGTEAPFDLMVANLPYVSTSDIETLAPEVRSEPRLALDGGKDGLDVIRRLVRAAPALLGAGGSLLLEIGAGQSAVVASLCRAAGLGAVKIRQDLAGIDRVIAAQRMQGQRS